ncbi:hypothetical protein P7K49_000117 [Saguinus oedipus]|uniref:Uncharacterized protein n=1 Tax=Saguinus oedipus TaxID=9490 RepID=A0ABQ9WBL9_SAGOE|nr:hypothetical protein P7K49_000117 [Saguinus oedipus]
MICSRTSQCSQGSSRGLEGDQEWKPHGSITGSQGRTRGFAAEPSLEKDSRMPRGWASVLPSKDGPLPFVHPPRQTQLDERDGRGCRLVTAASSSDPQNEGQEVARAVPALSQGVPAVATTKWHGRGLLEVLLLLGGPDSGFGEGNALFSRVEESVQAARSVVVTQVGSGGSDTLPVLTAQTWGSPGTRGPGDRTGPIASRN